MTQTAKNASGQFTHPEHASEGVARVRELIKGIPICMLTTAADDGSLVSRPMAVQEVEFDGDLWFFTQADAHKISEVKAEHHVNAAFSSSSTWISLAGKAEVVNDDELKEKFWNAAASAWLEGGPHDDSVRLLRVHADSAEVWEGPGRAATVIALVKSAAGQGQPDVGSHETVKM